MKKLLLWSIMLCSLKVFPSGVENQIEVLKKAHAEILASKKKADELFNLTKQQQIDALKNLQKAKEREDEYGKNVHHAAMLHKAIEVIEYNQKYPEDSRRGSLPCLIACRFLLETANQNKAALRTIDAIEGRDTIGNQTPRQVLTNADCTDCGVCLRSCTYGCLSWYVSCLCCSDGYPYLGGHKNGSMDYCGDYEKRTKASYLRDGVLVLAQNKLNELRQMRQIISPQTMENRCNDEGAAVEILAEGRSFINDVTGGKK